MNNANYSVWIWNSVQQIKFLFRKTKIKTVVWLILYTAILKKHITVGLDFGKNRIITEIIFLKLTFPHNLFVHV